MKVLITGGTNGMGKGVAKILADINKQAHEIIILCRSQELGEAVIKELVDATSNKKVSIILCDLAKLADVKRAIIEIHEKHEFLDGIFINAGLGYAKKRIETEDGFDSHFQVNYLSQFMLTLNLLDLLRKSDTGGRVIFNVTRTGEIYWDDMQMNKKWNYENGVHQAMVAKRMFLVKLNSLNREMNDSNISFVGFEISKTVWSNQFNLIPTYMKIMATLMKSLGTFISIEECGRIMKPLFIESQHDSLKKSGKLITWKKNRFIELKEDSAVLDKEMQDKLWRISLDLCADDKTNQISEDLLKK
jgi:hypothetical protein